MELPPKQPTTKAPAETFTGDAWYDVIAKGEEPSRPGDTIYTPPGEWHWHGAAPDHFMSHLAIWEGVGEGQGPETAWGDLVSDEEYGS